MSTDEKNPIAENESPNEVEDTPLTKEMFVTQIHRLFKRARVAGVNPIYTMAQTYASKGMSIVEGVLGALESNADNPKKKRK